MDEHEGQREAPKPVRVEFERSGGFGGFLIQATIDAESLTPEEAGELNELVQAAEFFELPEKLTSRSPGTDRFQYKVTIESEETTHTVETSDAAAPETLQPLLRRLTLLARSSRAP